jgi:hypothetical protein
MITREIHIRSLSMREKRIKEHPNNLRDFRGSSVLHSGIKEDLKLWA